MEWSSGIAVTAVAVLLAAKSLASTYVVDSHGGPGVDFTDLPPAVAAALPGDVLLVRSGAYSSFLCSQGITILGYGSPIVDGAAMVFWVPADQVAIVTGLAATNLVVSGCEGPVVLQQISPVQTVTIEDSLDVRLLEVNPAYGPSGEAGVSVTSSRVEVVQSTIRGGEFFNTCRDPGGEGVKVASASRVHIALSDLQGGFGPQYCFDLPHTDVADGAAGLAAVDSEVFLAGGGQRTVIGGGGGFNLADTNCYFDGDGAPGITALNAAVFHSGTRVFGGWGCGSGSTSDPNCYCFQVPAFSGGTIAQEAPADSTLALSGTPIAGQAVTLTLRGAPGSDAVIWLGRHWILQAETGIDIELAVDRQRVVNLGVMPSGGSISAPLTIPSSYLPGTHYGVQGECRFASGTVRRSNSIPVVVR